MKKTIMTAAVTGVLLAGVNSGANAASLNLLANPGFETGNFSGWSVSGAVSGVGLDGVSIPGTYVPQVVNTHSGSYAAWARVAVNLPQISVFSQTIEIAPNSTYDVGFWLSLGSDSGAGRDYRIVVNGTTILDVSRSGWPEDYWVGYDPTKYLYESAVYHSGAGVFSAKVDFYLSGSFNALVGYSYDDFHFTGPEPVPVPAAAWLFGSGLLGLSGLMRARRKPVVAMD